MGSRDRKDAGDRAERVALSHLLAAGLQLVTRNYRCKAGEVDLVMLEGEILVLVEVRFRRNALFGGAAASVIHRKRRRLIKTAHHLLLTRSSLRRYPARFDVVAIDGSVDGALQVDWIKDAFRV